MTSRALVYPALYARFDLGFARINGAGLGNCLFSYSHAVAIAHQNDARVLAPAWQTLAVSSKLRGRRFGDVMQPHPGEIAGPVKAWILARHAWRAHRFTAKASDALQLRDGLSIISAPYVFDGLHKYRDLLRARILSAMSRPPAPFGWGRGDYVAMHVRLGDFAVADEDMLDRGEAANLRIPMKWYVEIARRLRRDLPNLPIKVYSNGTAEDMAALLSIHGVDLQQEDNDVAELLGMARARVLVGSHSTFSQWAAFLGNMPTMWRYRIVRPERPTDADVPLFMVDRNMGGFPGTPMLDRLW